MLMAVMTDDDIASDNVDEKDEEIGDDDVDDDVDDDDDDDDDEQAEEIGDAEVLLKVHLATDPSLRPVYSFTGSQWCP